MLSTHCELLSWSLHLSSPTLFLKNKKTLQSLNENIIEKSILCDLHVQTFHYKYEMIKQWNAVLLKYREYEDNQGPSTQKSDFRNRNWLSYSFCPKKSLQGIHCRGNTSLIKSARGNIQIRKRHKQLKGWALIWKEFIDK